MLGVPDIYTEKFFGKLHEAMERGGIKVRRPGSQLYTSWLPEAVHSVTCSFFWNQVIVERIKEPLNPFESYIH